MSSPPSTNLFSFIAAILRIPPLSEEAIVPLEKFAAIISPIYLCPPSSGSLVAFSILFFAYIAPDIGVRVSAVIVAREFQSFETLAWVIFLQSTGNAMDLSTVYEIDAYT